MSTQGVPPPSTLKDRQPSMDSRLSSVLRSENGVQ